jgi:hypothetical protein
MPEREPKPSPFTLEEVTRIAQETLLRDGKHVPTIIADGSKQPVVTQVLDLADTHDGRMQQMFSVGFLLAESRQVGKLHQVFFITEAWMSTPHEGKLPEQPPSQDPQRKEVMMIASFYVRDRQQKGVVLEMVRNQEGHLTELTLSQGKDRPKRAARCCWHLRQGSAPGQPPASIS